MANVQTNVRVPPNDRPVVCAVAARLRNDPRFRERLRLLLEEEASPALEERIARLEVQVRQLLADNPRSAERIESRMRDCITENSEAD